MATSKTFIPRFFSNGINLSIPAETIQHLLQNKFDGEGEMSILEHTLQFLEFCHSKVHCKDVACKIFMLMLEGCVK